MGRFSAHAVVFNEPHGQPACGRPILLEACLYVFQRVILKVYEDAQAGEVFFYLFYCVVAEVRD